MIVINNLEISDNLESISVEVSSTDDTALFTEIYFWDMHTFQDSALSVDLSGLLLSESNTEVFTISATDVGIEYFHGLFFLQFKTDESSIPLSSGVTPNETLGIVYNSFLYKNCLLNKVASIEVTGCAESTSGCTDCKKDISFLSVMLTSAENAISMYYYEEAIKILKEVESLCETCHSCLEVEDTLSYNGVGLGYQMRDNRVIPNTGGGILIPIIVDDNNPFPIGL